MAEELKEQKSEGRKKQIEDSKKEFARIKSKTPLFLKYQLQGNY
jgi:hypothetical protein